MPSSRYERPLPPAGRSARPTAGQPPRAPAGQPPRAPAGQPPRPTSGRHRRPGSRRRPVLLTALAVVTLLLSSGTAISLTGAPAPPPAGPELAALGAAPVTDTPTTPSPTPSEVTSRAVPPTPTPTPPADDPPARSADRPRQPPPAPPGGDQSDQLTSLEDEVVQLTNQERRAAGCDDVVTDERLRTAARGHSQDMAINDYFDHTSQDGRSPFDRMRDAGYPNPAGENIAYGYRTPADVMAGWMNSDGHRRNLLSCGHRAIGVGLAYNDGGRPYWTQVFGR